MDDGEPRDVDGEREPDEPGAGAERRSDTPGDVFYVLDADGELRRWNEALAVVTGYDHEELGRLDASEIFPGETSERIEAAIEEAKDVGAATVEATVEPKGGGTIPYEFHGARMTGPDGDLQGVVGVGRDVSERHEREAQLDTLARRFEAVFENPLTLIGLLEPDGTLIEANPTARSLVEWPDVADEPFWDTPWWNHSAELREQLQTWVDRAADGEHVRFEAEHPAPDGGAIAVDGVIHPVRDEEDDVTELVAIARDVTDREDRERALTELHAAAVDLEDSESESAVCDRTIESAREVLEFDLCVVNLEEDGMLPVAATSEELPEDGVTVMSVDEGLAGETYRTGESFLVDDVTTVEAADPQGPYRAAISVPVGDHGVFQVVDERPGTFDENDLELAELLVSHTAAALDRLDRERQLQEQNERLDEFASIVSHDLRNPLNVLDGSLELAEETGQPEHFEDCRWAVERMDQLIEGLLTLAREGETVDESAPVETASVVEAAWRAAGSDAATLQVETDRVVEADRERLRQLLENLVRNAVEHAGDGVTVTVGELDGGFFVEDDGPGIPADEREAVLDAGYSTAGNGTGLGLAIVRRIAEAHGWTVTVTAGADGGARFEIRNVEPAG